MDAAVYALSQIAAAMKPVKFWIAGFCHWMNGGIVTLMNAIAAGSATTTQHGHAISMATATATDGTTRTNAGSVPTSASRTASPIATSCASTI